MNLGYPKSVLSSRSIIKKNNFALIAPEGLVKNIVPGFENCEMSILGSPKLGACFVDYIIRINPGGGNFQGFGGDGVETFVYCIEGGVGAKAGSDSFHLSQGGYLYSPPGCRLFLENDNKKECLLFLHKRMYINICGVKAQSVSGNENEIVYRVYEGMENVKIKDLLPLDMAYDMNMHILSFDPGGCHPMIETHYQEHGAYILSGKGVYNLDNEWIPVKKDDYIYMSAYSLQGAYGVGTEPFSYIYSKDCNRDAEL